MRNLESIPGESGHKAVDTVDRMPTHHGVQSHTVTHNQPTMHVFRLVERSGVHGRNL